VERPRSEFPESFFNAFTNRLIVAAGGAGTDDEVVRERANVPEFDDHNILSFFVESALKGFCQQVVFFLLVNGILL